MQVYHLCSLCCIQAFPQGSTEDTLETPGGGLGGLLGYDLFTLERAMQGHSLLFNVILVFLHPQTNSPAGLTEEKDFKRLVQGHPKEWASQATYSRALSASVAQPAFLLLQVVCANLCPPHPIAFPTQAAQCKVHSKSSEVPCTTHPSSSWDKNSSLNLCSWQMFSWFGGVFLSVSVYPQATSWCTSPCLAIWIALQDEHSLKNWGQTWRRLKKLG